MESDKRNIPHNLEGPIPEQIIGRTLRVHAKVAIHAFIGLQAKHRLGGRPKDALWSGFGGRVVKLAMGGG